MKGMEQTVITRTPPKARLDNLVSSKCVVGEVERSAIVWRVDWDIRGGDVPSLACACGCRRTRAYTWQGAARGLVAHNAIIPSTTLWKWVYDETTFHVSPNLPWSSHTITFTFVSYCIITSFVVECIPVYCILFCRSVGLDSIGTNLDPFLWITYWSTTASYVSLR